MYGNEKRRDVPLMLAGAVPQEQVAERTGVSVRTIRRIAGKPSGLALPAAGSASAAVPTQPQGQPKRPGSGQPSAAGPYRDAATAMLAGEFSQHTFFRYAPAQYRAVSPYTDNRFGLQ